MLAPALAGAAPEEAREAPTEAVVGLPLRAFYDEGFRLDTLDGDYALRLQLRAQLRFAYPFDTAPATAPELEEAGEAGGDFELQRARLKIGGHAYRPWLGYYLEYDFPNSRLLDWRFTLQPREELGLRVGQWKAEFTRERRDSSGNQQFVERSIVNEVFTLDRQVGAMLLGRVGKGTAADLHYFAGVFAGDGRGSGNEDDGWMGFGRLQWNPLGREVPFSQSDLPRSIEPALSIALAGVTNRSRYTAFSSSGGGQLPGFEDDGTDRYRTEQWMVDLAFRYRGFSLQHEFHRKRIDDREAGATQLQGSYVQAGFFPGAILEAVPDPLEIALRYAFVDPDTDRRGDLREEWTVGLNWFFSGHRNKLTLDASMLTVDDPEAPDAREPRVRLQWDISI